MNEHPKISSHDVVILERAMHLKVLSDFESKLLPDRRLAHLRYGDKTQMTEKQRAIIQSLADRYCAAMGIPEEVEF